MRFTIRRASVWDDEKSPCEEAERDSIVRVETRTCMNPEEFDERFGKLEGKWLSVGENHRVNEKGWIVRDNGMVDVWSVEINTFDELIKFHDKYGDLVIGRCMWNNTYREILIYDDYIE